MALFGGNDKVSKKQESLLDKYGLENVNVKDAQSIQKILNDLRGCGAMKTGMALSFGKAEDQMKVAYLSAMVEQNWIIIRQLDRLNKLLEK